MINSGIAFEGKIEYTLFDKDGNVKDDGVIKNQVQDLLMQRVIDAIDGGTMTALQGMAVGTGTGQAVTDSALASKASDEDITGGQTQPTATSLQNVGTFTSITGTVTEAGLFDDAACTDDMYCYDDSLNVVMTSSDSLQITWTISCTSA